MESAPSRNKQVALFAAITVVALLLGGVIGWLIRSGEVTDLEDRVAEAETRIEELEDADEPEAPEDPEDPEDPEAPEEPEEPETPAVVERVPAEVVSVRTSGGVHYLTLDYIQFLGGAEAAAAATAHGDESPPPNDYYIVNDNPKLREFPIQAGISVSVVFWPDGSMEVEGTPMSLATWVAGLGDPASDELTWTFYWVTLTDGTITGLEQQFLP